MKRFSTLLLYVTIAFLLLWQLPWCYNFFVVKPEKISFTLCSSVIGDFVMMGQEEEKGTVRCDLTGNIYSETVFASILSMFYFRRLMSDERFSGHSQRSNRYSQDSTDGELQLPKCPYRYKYPIYQAVPSVGVHVRTRRLENARHNIHFLYG